jgi:hypothetical protein
MLDALSPEQNTTTTEKAANPKPVQKVEMSQTQPHSLLHAIPQEFQDTIFAHAFAGSRASHGRTNRAQHYQPRRDRRERNASPRDSHTACSRAGRSLDPRLCSAPLLRRKHFPVPRAPSQPRSAAQLDRHRHPRAWRLRRRCQANPPRHTREEDLQDVRRWKPCTALQPRPQRASHLPHRHHSAAGRRSQRGLRGRSRGSLRLYDAYRSAGPGLFDSQASPFCGWGSKRVSARRWRSQWTPKKTCGSPCSACGSSAIPRL